MNRIYHYLSTYAHITCQSKSTVIVTLGSMSLKQFQNAKMHGENGLHTSLEREAETECNITIER